MQVRCFAKGEIYEKKAIIIGITVVLVGGVIAAVLLSKNKENSPEEKDAKDSERIPELWNIMDEYMYI